MKKFPSRKQPQVEPIASLESKMSQSPTEALASGRSAARDDIVISQEMVQGVSKKEVEGE